MRISATKAIRDRVLVGVLRSVEGIDDVDGFVLAASADWFLVRDCEELMPSGLWLFRKDTITSFQRSKFHQFKERMMERAGLLRRGWPPPEIDLTNIETIVEWLTRTKRLCILRTENADEWWRVHCAIDGLIGQQLRIHPFDGAGQWEKVRTTGRWRLNAITAIRFDSHYLRLYEKYVTRRPRK